MSATIKDVARAANVSIATVSRILNNQSGYSQKTKKRVMKAIDLLDYKPNAIARGLISKRTKTIGVLLPDVSGLVTSPLLKGIEEAAYASGHSVTICHTSGFGERTVKYLRVLKEKQVDGFLFMSETADDSFYQEIRRTGMPAVLLAAQSPGCSIPYVKVDERMAAYSAASYLIQKGHRKIGMISDGRKDVISAKLKAYGFAQALEDHGIPFHQKQVCSGEGGGFEAGADALPKLFEQSGRVTAVFAANDFLAAGALRAAFEMGLCVPDELSVIGYDDLEIAAMTLPSLTTVAQPFTKIGKTGGDMLIGMIEGKNDKDAEGRILPHRIVERRSVCMKVSAS